MIKAFLFDYDGVITEGADDNYIFGTLATSLNIPIEQVRDWLMEVWRPYIQGLMTQQDVWKHVENRYGKKIDDSAKDIWFAWKELQPLPEMLDLVESLKEHGYKVGVLSNAFIETAHIIEEHGAYEPFDFRVLSCETGYAKPDKEIFHLALKEFGDVLPQEVVFLDDREKNVLAAQELGMIGIYVTDHLEAVDQVKELISRT